mgnify:CR=1 FL=1
MEKNIIALLNTNLRVIIPDFGAFIIRQKEPKIIVFNEFLRYNDGLLIDYIAKSEGIEKEIAQLRVTDFAEDATKILDSGKPFIIAGLGLLQKDNSGKISFNAEVIPEIVNVKPEIAKSPARKKAPASAIPKTKSKAASKARSVPKAPAPKAPVPKVPVSEAPVPPLPVVEQPVIETPVVEPPVTDIPVWEPQPAEPFFIKQPVTESSAPSESFWDILVGKVKSFFSSDIFRTEPGRINQILLWILLILFVNAAILAWFVFKDDGRDKPANKAAPQLLSDSVFQALSDSVRKVAEDTSLVFANEAIEEPAVTESGTVPDMARYYIVAGCFRDEANANLLVESLKEKGYNAEKFGIIGNLHAVSFASFDDKEMAVKELQHIRETVPDAWMTRF